MSALTAVAGTALPPLALRVTRETAVRYAGASGDFNPIHYSDHAAAALGLDSVLVQGMWTMGAALRVVTDWCGPQALLSYAVRFTRQVPVPDDGQGTLVEFGATIDAVADGVATLTVTATCDGDKVLGQAKATVRCD